MNDKIYKMKNHQDHFLFLKDCFQNNFPHSWIFHGPHGVGKYKFTIEFIKSVVRLGYKPGIITLNPIMFDKLLKKYEVTGLLNDLIVCFNINKECIVLNII